MGATLIRTEAHPGAVAARSGIPQAACRFASLTLPPARAKRNSRHRLAFLRFGVAIHRAFNAT